MLLSHEPRAAVALELLEDRAGVLHARSRGHVDRASNSFQRRGKDVVVGLEELVELGDVGVGRVFLRDQASAQTLDV